MIFFSDTVSSLVPSPCSKVHLYVYCIVYYVWLEALYQIRMFLAPYQNVTDPEHWLAGSVLGDQALQYFNILHVTRLKTYIVTVPAHSPGN
jgi:hypothetical protein